MMMRMKAWRRERRPGGGGRRAFMEGNGAICDMIPSIERKRAP